MESRIRWVVVLVVVGTIAAIAVAIAFFGPPPTEPANPLRDLVFFADRDVYTLGGEVHFVLVNRANVNVTFVDWTVQRFIDGEWVGVECHVQEQVERGLRPGDRMVWHWTVESEDPVDCGGLQVPSVDPGAYRGTIFVRAPPLSEIDSLSTEFDVV